MDPVENEKTGTENETIVIDAPESVAPEPAPTVEDANAEGLDPREIEAGKKAGLIAEADKPKNEDEDAATADQKRLNGDKPTPVQKRREQPPWEKDVPPEERERVDKYGPNEKALYWDRKREKYRRQKAEDERDQLRAQIQYFKGKAEALERNPAADKPKDGATPQLDEFGDPIDGDNEIDPNKPLTKADLERIEQEKIEKARKQQEESKVRQSAVIETLNQQEQEFREENPDFGDVFDNFTGDIVRADAKKLEELFPKRAEREGVKSMVRDWLVRLREPEKYSGTDSAAALAYEIGKLHPKFSEADPNAADGEGIDGDEGNEDSDDEGNLLEKRLGHQRRPSSASLNGGRRPKSIKDLTTEDLAFMSTDQIRRLKREYPNQVERILREG